MSPSSSVATTRAAAPPRSAARAAATRPCPYPSALTTTPRDVPAGSASPDQAGVPGQRAEVHLEPRQPRQRRQPGGGEARLDGSVGSGPGSVGGHGRATPWRTAMNGTANLYCPTAKVYYDASSIATPSPAPQRSRARVPTEGVSLGHRSRGRPHHRRRCLRRRGRATAGRGRLRSRVPGAGTLARPGGVPRRRAGLGADHAQAVVDEPQRARPARGLPDRRDGRGGLAAHVLGRRRFDADLRRRLAPDAAVGLPGPLPGRDRGRLAADLRGAAPVLRAERP